MSKRYPPFILATCVVPWKADWTLDQDLFAEEIRLLRDNLTRHLYLYGTAGEGYAVGERQFDEIVSLFQREMSGPDDHRRVGLISSSLTTISSRPSTPTWWGSSTAGGGIWSPTSTCCLRLYTYPEDSRVQVLQEGIPRRWRL